MTHILAKLIEQGTTDFLFGDHSAFNDLCYQTVTALKEKYPAIRRIHFRKDYEEPDDETLRLLRSQNKRRRSSRKGKTPSFFFVRG